MKAHEINNRRTVFIAFGAWTSLYYIYIRRRYRFFLYAFLFSFKKGKERKRNHTYIHIGIMGNTNTNNINGSSTAVVEIPANFKPTLPPRKRAKTKEEKEQRRIERILRNRKAAHHSREKKRLHLQLLEHKCHVMEQILSRIDGIEGVIGSQDVEGVKLLEEYRSLSKESSSFFVETNGSEEGFTPTTAANSPIMVKVEDEVNDSLSEIRLADFSQVEELQPVVDLKEEISSFSVPTFSSNSSCGSDSSFSPNMALTPVSYNKEDEGKNWDLLLTRTDNMKVESNLFTSQESSNAPPLWLTMGENENSSFEFDDWRNPAVITAITLCI